MINYFKLLSAIGIYLRYYGYLINISVSIGRR